MPLYTTEIVAPNTKVLVWKITESFSELYQQVSLTPERLVRLNSMKSVLHQRGFLSVRMLLQAAGYTDYDLWYDHNGKPYLTNKTAISITHSFDFSAIILSDNNTGIDIEKTRDKVIRIADKFIDFENTFLNHSDTELLIKQLMIIWGVKESVYKYHSQPGLSLKEHINVMPFTLESPCINAFVQYQNTLTEHKAIFKPIQEYWLTYLLQK